MSECVCVCVFVCVYTHTHTHTLHYEKNLVSIAGNGREGGRGLRFFHLQLMQSQTLYNNKKGLYCLIKKGGGPQGLQFAVDTITHPYNMPLALLALVAKVQPGPLRPRRVCKTV